MLYFRFNGINFVAPQQEVTVTKYEGGKPIFPSQKEISTLTMGEIEGYFFDKLRNELQLPEVGIGSAMYDVIGIPVDAFSIDDEVIGNFDGVLKFALSEYAKLPIKELNNKSLNDIGIEIEFCKRILNKEIEEKLQKYMKENNLEYITEEVLWKNMTDDEKAKKFSQYLREIDSEGNELIIVDPYFFSGEENDYCDLLASILKQSKAKKIIVVTDKHNCKEASFNKIFNKMNKVLEVKYNNSFHDRFWITDRKKGFYTGTSFNGIGKKISLINTIPLNDVNDIIDELSAQSLI